MVENACEERSFTLPRDRKPFDNEANFFQGGSNELCRSIKQEANVNLEQKSISFIRADVVAEGGPPPSGEESNLSPEGSGSEESSEYKLSKMFDELSSGERRVTHPPGFAQHPAPISEATRLEQKKFLNIAFSGKIGQDQPTLLQKEAPLFLPPQEPGRPSVLRVVAEYTAEEGTDDRPHKCRQCSRAFKKASNLKSHVETHRGLKPHVCELCGKAYSHQGTLQQHKRLHTGERPYCCPFCIRTYIWSSDFRKHIRTHTGEKPYTCGACGKAFVRSSDLRKHERNIHTNNKPLPCQECGKTFNKPLSLLRHQRTHLGERPFLCPDCGKAFAVASRMVEHQRTHSGARPYICPVCLKAFTKSSNLAEHQTLHSGLRPFKCGDCNAAFAQPSRLVRHRHVHVRQGPHLLPQPCPP